MFLYTVMAGLFRSLYQMRYHKWISIRKQINAELQYNKRRKCYTLKQLLEKTCHEWCTESVSNSCSDLILLKQLSGIALTEMKQNAMSTRCIHGFVDMLCKFLPLIFLPTQQSSYVNFVSSVNKHLRKILGEKDYSRMSGFRLRVLIFDSKGNPLSRNEVSKQEKCVQETKLCHRLTNRIRVSGSVLISAMHTLMKSVSFEDRYIRLQLYIGCRRIELLNEDVSNFEAHPTHSFSLVQHGFAKARRMSKCIRPMLPIHIIDKETDNWDARRVVQEVDEVRSIVKSWDPLGRLTKSVLDKVSRRVTPRIRSLFPIAANFADSKREQGIATHFLRKVYANCAAHVLRDPNEHINAWLTRHMGWTSDRPLVTSLFYVDVMYHCDIPHSGCVLYE